MQMDLFPLNTNPLRRDKWGVAAEGSKSLAFPGRFLVLFISGSWGALGGNWWFSLALTLCLLFSQAQANCRVGIAALNTLAGYIDWVALSHITADNCKLLEMLCLLLNEPELQVGAAECLLIAVSRKVSSSSLALLSPFYFSPILLYNSSDWAILSLPFNLRTEIQILLILLKVFGVNVMPAQYME